MNFFPRECRRHSGALLVRVHKGLACRVPGKRILSMVWQPNLSQACGAAMFSTILHGCRAAPPFGLSPKRGQKRFFPSIRRPRRMSRPLLTGSDRLPPKAACCKPVHARSPAVFGRLFWRPPPVDRQCSGVGRPICGAPDAAEPVEQKPLPPHAAGVRKSAFFR